MTKNLCIDFGHNLAFWMYCKSKPRNGCELSDPKMADGKLACYDKTKAKLLNHFFLSVFTHMFQTWHLGMYKIQDSFNMCFSTDVIDKKV